MGLKGDSSPCLCKGLLGICAQRVLPYSQTLVFSLKCVFGFTAETSPANRIPDVVKEPHRMHLFQTYPVLKGAANSRSDRNEDNYPILMRILQALSALCATPPFIPWLTPGDFPAEELIVSSAPSQLRSAPFPILTDRQVLAQNQPVIITLPVILQGVYQAAHQMYAQSSDRPLLHR